MALTAMSFAMFAQLGTHDTYAADILPGILVAGIGLGIVFATATDVATRGVSSADVGAAMVNATNQVGGSLGLALLSTISAAAAGHYLAGRHPTPNLVAGAAVHGYTTAYWWAVGFFAAGAAVSALLLRRR
jgi:hypothetical protein